MAYYTLAEQENFFLLQEEGNNFKLFVNNEFLFVINKDSDFGSFPIVTKILAKGKKQSL